MTDETPYAKCPSIIIRFMDTDGKTDRDAWRKKVNAHLDQIHNIRLGFELMAEIRQTSHTVYVQPALASSNQCAAANSNCYVKLRQALDFSGANFAHELKTAFERAERAKISIDGIARRLASGMSSVTVETARNVAKASGKPVGYEKRKTDRKGKVVYERPGVAKWVDAKMMSHKKMKDLLQGLCNGTRSTMDLQMKRNGRMLGDDLIRCFYVPDAQPETEFLQRGEGCSATISFKPDVTQSCWLNEHVQRPPAVGLVHELIHAWRNVKGLRYFKDKEKVDDAPTPDDEVMTTGFPPYQWEKFTENQFRTLWADHDVGSIQDFGSPMHGAQPLRHKY